jgi:hypothetical protein
MIDTDNLFKRYGTFSISRKMIQEYPKMVMRLMSNVIIVKASADYYTDSVRYYAYSEHFDLVAEGCGPVRYDVKTNGIDFMFMDITL